MAKKTAAQLQREINAALARKPTSARSGATLGQPKGRAHATKREIDVYTFDELSPKAKDRAITDYRHSGAAFDSSDTEMLSETFRDQLKEKGLPSDDVRWRLSSSQGDGVAFYGQFDLKEYLSANKLKSKFPALTRVADDIAANIEKIGPHMYDHWNTMRVHLEPQVDLTDGQEAERARLKEQLASDIKDVSRELEKAGYADIEYREGDEQIAETIKANDYEFDVNGKWI